MSTEDPEVERVPAHMVATWPDGLRAVWHGGEYADLYHPEASEPFDAINMWDYERGEPRVPFAPHTFAREVAAWRDAEEGTDDE